MRYLDWSTDGRQWPNRFASRFVVAGGVSWHVQIAGEGAPILLLHGTGASTHTWRDVIPQLMTRYQVIAPDLPGLGFSRVQDRQSLSLPGMSTAIAQLLKHVEIDPLLIVGHSAGAAIGLQHILNSHDNNISIVGINPAVLPLTGAAGQMFLPMARLLASFGVVPRLFTAYSSGPSSVRRLLERTGSNIDEAGERLYGRLIRNEQHVSATLEMMARWDLSPLVRSLPSLHSRTHIMVGLNDRTIPPHYGRALMKRLVNAPATYSEVQDCGHLLHEEQPGLLVRMIESMFGVGAVDVPSAIGT
jgi:magnesium chelatase accessory protein